LSWGFCVEGQDLITPTTASHTPVTPMHQDHPDIEKLPLEIGGIPIRETIREIFRDPENGTPDGITKAGCLALALKSNEIGGRHSEYVIWNAWRKLFPEIYTKHFHKNVTNFSGQDFRKLKIDFSRFLMGNGANFNYSIWGDDVQFLCSQWGIDARLVLSKWGSGANFMLAQFARGADFSGSVWGAYAKFNGTQFGNNSTFGRSHFLGDVDFSSESSQVYYSYLVFEDALAEAKSTENLFNLSSDKFRNIDFFRW
jgi:hypothetical protein